MISRLYHHCVTANGWLRSHEHLKKAGLSISWTDLNFSLSPFQSFPVLFTPRFYFRALVIFYTPTFLLFSFSPFCLLPHYSWHSTHRDKPHHFSIHPFQGKVFCTASNSLIERHLHFPSYNFGLQMTCILTYQTIFHGPGVLVRHVPESN